MYLVYSDIVHTFFVKFIFQAKGCPSNATNSHTLGEAASQQKVGAGRTGQVNRHRYRQGRFAFYFISSVNGLVNLFR